MIGPPGFIDKTIREDKTTFDKTAIAQQMLDILSGYREIEGVQQLIGTILTHTIEKLRASELPESMLLMLPNFFSNMLAFYAQATKPEERSVFDQLLGRRPEQPDPRAMAMEDTRFLVALLREAQGRGASEERRKIVLDQLLVQIGALATHGGITAEHKARLNKFANLLLSSGEDDQGT